MLTDSQVKALKAKDGAYKVSDQRGLYVMVTPSGSKLWRFKYYFQRRERVLALGQYPDLTLALARLKHQEARTLLAQGIDPGEAKKQKKLEVLRRSTFHQVARMYFDAGKGSKWNDATAKEIQRKLNVHLFPSIGALPIETITVSVLVGLLEQIKVQSGVMTARQVRSLASQVFQYGIARGIVHADPSAHLGSILPSPKTTHRRALTDPEQLRPFLKRVGSLDFLDSRYIRLLMLTFVRPKELRFMQWSQINWVDELWSYHIGKTETDHMVPLSTQALEILAELRQYGQQGRQYVFALPRNDRPIGGNKVHVAINKISSEQSLHGFRATARTLIVEQLGERVDLVETQLGHRVRDPLGRAYNRTEFLPERRRMMQRWGDYLKKLGS